MFEELKTQIRQEIQNRKVKNINDDVAVELKNLISKAIQDKNFDKAIAIQELYLDDLGGIYAENVLGVKVHLLQLYRSCGYCNTAEALSLVTALLNEKQQSGVADIVLGEIDVPAIRVLYMTEEIKYQDMAKEIAMSCINVWLNNIGKWANDDGFKLTVQTATRELMRIYIKENKYKEADDLYYRVGSTSRELTDPISCVFFDMLMAYGLTDTGVKFINEAIEDIKNLADVVPEACFILGIMSAEGYKCNKSVQMAQYYFDKGNKLADSLKGSVGYSDFDFYVLSEISQTAIVKIALNGDYRSKFYSTKIYLNYSDSKNTTSSNLASSSSSSGGCYVATAVYGSYDCPEVWTLRRYRDNQLAKTWYGRFFIHTYYAISPTIVKWFGDTKWFKHMWRGKLDKMVKKLQNSGIEDTPYNDIKW